MRRREERQNNFALKKISPQKKVEIEKLNPECTSRTRSTGTDVTFEVDNVERKKLAPAVGHVHVYLLHPSSKQKGDQHLRFKYKKCTKNVSVNN